MKMSKQLQVENTKQNREDIIEHVKSLDSIYSNQHYIYELKHYYEETPSYRYVEVNIEPAVMDILLAYFQFKTDSIDDGFSFSQHEAVPILGELYGAIDLGDDVVLIDEEFDLYDNWEKWCGVADRVEELDILGHDQLEDELKRLISEEEKR